MLSIESSLTDTYWETSGDTSWETSWEQLYEKLDESLLDYLSFICSFLNWYLDVSSSSTSLVVLDLLSFAITLPYVDSQIEGLLVRDLVAEPPLTTSSSWLNKPEKFFLSLLIIAPLSLCDGDSQSLWLYKFFLSSRLRNFKTSF